MRKLLVISQHPTGKHRTIHNFSGCLDAQSSQPLEKALIQIKDSSDTSIILNFTEVDHIDSSGLKHLAIFLVKLKITGRDLAAYGMDIGLQQLMSLSHLDEIITIFPGVEEALNGIHFEEVNKQETQLMQDPVNLPGWAGPGQIANFGDAPEKVINLNINGRQPTSPVQGYGRMLLKTYRIPLPRIPHNPEEVMEVWKHNFTDFWPEGNLFYPSTSQIRPGETALINLTLAGGIKLATGAIIMYEDDSSFSLMTIQGHMFSGWITFSCFEEDGLIYAQNQALIRPNDPLFEISFLLGFGAKAEDVFWHETLKNLALRFGRDMDVIQTDELIDKHRQWQYARNIWHNAGVHSGIYQFTTPFRWLAKQMNKNRR